MNKWKFHLAAAFFIIVVLVFLPISIIAHIYINITLSMAWWRMTLFVLTQECSLLILFLILFLLVWFEFSFFCLFVLLFLVLLMVLAAHSSQSWNILVTVIYHINKLFIEKDNSSFLFCSQGYILTMRQTLKLYTYTNTHTKKKVYDQFLYQVWFSSKKEKTTFFSNILFHYTIICRMHK